MINKAVILGRLGQDPDIRTMQNGDKVANFSLAVTESWKDKASGERKEKTEWVNCVVFGGAVKVIEQYARKGNRLYIEGKIQTRSWEKDGEKKYATEVVVQGFGGTVQIIDWPDSQHNEVKASVHQEEMEDSIPW